MRDDVGSESERERERVYELMRGKSCVSRRLTQVHMTLHYRLLAMSNEKTCAHTHTHSFRKFKFKLIPSGWFNWFNRKKMKQIPNYSISTMHGMHRALTVRTYYPNESMGKRKPSGAITCEQKMILWHRRHQCLPEEKKYRNESTRHSGTHKCDNVIICRQRHNFHWQFGFLFCLALFVLTFIDRNNVHREAYNEQGVDDSAVKTFTASTIRAKR